MRCIFLEAHERESDVRRLPKNLVVSRSGARLVPTSEALFHLIIFDTRSLYNLRFAKCWTGLRKLFGICVASKQPGASETLTVTNPARL
jgi:hypothetical protein